MANNIAKYGKCGKSCLDKGEEYALINTNSIRAFENSNCKDYITENFQKALTYAIDMFLNIVSLFCSHLNRIYIIMLTPVKFNSIDVF